MKNKVHVINPSELSYICNHCAYLKKNYDLENRGISVGVTQTLDSIEKKFFLGSTTKISENLPDGEVIDPSNDTFYSKILKDNKGRNFQIKGKGDALIKFNDGTQGIIDYKTSKFKEKNGGNYEVIFLKKLKNIHINYIVMRYFIPILKQIKNFKTSYKSKKTWKYKKCDMKLKKIDYIKTSKISRMD